MCVSVQSGRWTAGFRRNILSPFLGAEFIVTYIMYIKTVGMLLTFAYRHVPKNTDKRNVIFTYLGYAHSSSFLLLSIMWNREATLIPVTKHGGL